MPIGLPRRLATLVLSVLAAASWAAGGVDPASIPQHDWAGRRPSSITVLGCPPVPTAVYSLDSTGFNKYGTFRWKGQPGLTGEGADLMRANGYVERGELGLRAVEELFLGDPDTLLPHVPQERSGTLSCEVIREQLRNVPAGVKKALLLYVEVGHKQIDPRTNAKINSGFNRILTLVFDDVTDEDLRRIAYDDGVLRAFRFRED